ncbi:MAG TPA: FUSC family protein, partial [Puia sp.]|nr:FUSC family protein [Puia sp.]
TNTGRITLLIFIEIIDLFERIMSLQLHHHAFHQYFDNSNILQVFKNFLLQVSEELNKTGIVLKSGKAYQMNHQLENELIKLKKEFEEFRNKQMNPGNVEGFIELRALINACDDFVSRILTIQQYTSYDIKDVKKDSRVQNYDQFVSHQDIDAKVFLDNFNWKSNTFRHALRVSVATTTGFLISEFFPFGHGYWIMLTIIVILKPAYSITKGRNRDRLLGTLAGAAIGVLILMIVKDRYLLIGFMIVLMVLAYSFMRTRYLLFVTLMTPYILILLYILNPLHFKDLILDRIIDTAIGSVIALLANLLFSPEWTYRQFAEYLQQMLDANKNYFIDVTSFFTGSPVPVNQYKLSRKNAYVALANISDALNRMISEPKSKQMHVAEYHQLVTLNYMMATHIATLATVVLGKTKPAPDPEYLPVVRVIAANLDQAIERLKTTTDTLNASAGLIKSEPEGNQAGEGLSKLNQRMTDMVEIRKKELADGIAEAHFSTSLTGVKLINDQFNFIWKISEDLLKTLRA